MQYRKLGRTGIDVSVICLGTMTWGEQNTEAEAHAQLDLAVESGVNFIDAAEMYPVPPSAETYGRTQEYIGTWLKARGRRDRVILASKVIGRAAWLPYVRDGQACLNRDHIFRAVEASLKRLQTDYLDLYQLHWPDRPTNFFGKLGYTYDADGPKSTFAETLDALKDLQKQGKVRLVGLSNETPWGVMRYLQVAEERQAPRMVSIQNPYSLLNRTYEVGLAEVSHEEDIGLLAYSPLGFGVLSGKYLDGEQPAGARLTKWGERFARYSNPQSLAATERYCTLARANNITPTQLALAFVNQRSFVTSNIIGATSLEQLRENIGSSEVVLSDEVLAEIEGIHTEIPNPAP